MPSACCYFAQMGRTGPVKIGHAIDVDKRVNDLRVGSPWPLYVRLTIKTVDRERTTIAARHLERFLHELFAGYRMRGEWFRYAGELRWALEINNEGTRRARVAKLLSYRFRQHAEKIYFLTLTSDLWPRKTASKATRRQLARDSGLDETVPPFPGVTS